MLLSRGGGLYFVRWRLFRLLRDICKSLQVVRGGSGTGIVFKIYLSGAPWEPHKQPGNLSDDDSPHQLRRYLLAAVNKLRRAAGQTGRPVGRGLDGCQLDSLGWFLTGSETLTAERGPRAEGREDEPGKQNAEDELSPRL